MTPDSDRRPIKIVPKGLRSFDAGDADFFLELLPGPRDRDGLPEGIRFWKTRVEETDPDRTFAVGLLILDQFEQWLHAPPHPALSPSEGERGRGAGENTELVRALRQCDGGRVQAVVMVRDDFWMAATRFMQALEIRLVEAENCCAVDLFDLLHARKVLPEFGRAYGRLLDNLGQCTKDQDAGLAQDGKVVSVRLALFAEMVKGKAWTPATLREVGGTEGVGVAFLEETFAAPTAPPPAPQGRPGRPQGAAAGAGHGHQGPDALPARVAGSVGLWQPSAGL